MALGWKPSGRSFQRSNFGNYGAGNLTLRKAVDASAFTHYLIFLSKFVYEEQMNALKSVQNFKSFRETKKSTFPRGYPWMLKP